MWPDHTAPVGFYGKNNSTSLKNATDGLGIAGWGKGDESENAGGNGIGVETVIPLQFIGDASLGREEVMVCITIVVGVLGIVALL